MKVRNYKQADRTAVELIYQRAFSGPPWHNRELTQARVAECWRVCVEQSGFRCLIAEVEQRVIGFTCWDTPTLAELNKERGYKLADFVKRLEPERIVWIRETAVDPDYHGQGIATLLERILLDCIAERADNTAVLVRRRDDNVPIVRLSVSLGFQRSGIKVPSRRSAGVMHEYWFREVNQEKR